MYSTASLDKSIKEVQDTLQNNVHKLLTRGENLQSLASKANDLQNTSLLFKKRTKHFPKQETETKFSTSSNLSNSNSRNSNSSHSIKRASASNNLNKSSSDFDFDSLKEYKQKLLEHYNAGHYQYVLDKSSQLGLDEMVQHILKVSESHPLYLKLAEALLHAAHYGHVLIVEALLQNDIQNDYEQNKSISFLPFLDEPEIDFTNQSLSRSDLQKTIVTAHTNNHSAIAQMLQSYYYSTYNDKKE